jgi:non-specific serine/threonine protein kinase
MAECLRLLPEIGDRRDAAPCLELLTETAGDREAASGLSGSTAGRAARLLAAAERLRGDASDLWWPAERAAWEQHVAAIRAALGETAFREAWAQGQAMDLDAALAEARRIEL